MRPCLGVEGKGKETIRQVEFAIPTVDCGCLRRLLDGGVWEVLVYEVLIEVSREVNDQARFLAGFNDDVERLNAVGAGVIRLKFNDSVKFHVLSQPAADYLGIAKDGRGIGVFHSGGGWGELKGDTMKDPFPNEVEIVEWCVGFALHGCDGVQPKALFGIPSDISQRTEG
jgi:hypothetical protein